MPRLQRVLITAGAALAVTGAALAHSPTGKPPPAVEYGAVPAVAPATAPTSAPRPPKLRPVAIVPEPLRLMVPSIRTTAAVTPVGVRNDGSLILPAPDRIGWWMGGAVPGASSGSLVLAGHVDTSDGHHGALYNLSVVPKGAKVVVTSTNGTSTYQVVALRTYPKQALPRSLFTRAGPHRLLLITCGGPYHHGYTRNVVAYAVPVR
jgi:hypothetical protein